MGNPPFVGNARLSDEQKQDRQKIFVGNGGDLDYVACWYKKAADFMQGENIRCAFVSTNSICQGQQVTPLWQPLMNEGIKINFAYRTFVWDSESTLKAHVYCVIVGFSRQDLLPTFIYNDKQKIAADNINGYLLNAPNIFVAKRKTPLCDVPQVIKGFQPTDNGYLILDDNEKQELLAQEPPAAEWIRPFISAKEYIHGKNRWCLWLTDMKPHILSKLTKIKERVVACREWRLKQPKTGDAYKLRDIPMLMRPNGNFQEAPFIIIPLHTGENRRYIPFGFAAKGTIPGNSISLAIGANSYHFGVLCSNVHMAWTRAVCGRLEMRYRYTSDLVYNNFPWPNPTDKQKATIETTAQEILDARKKYPDSSLADLYDPASMPPELTKAHQANDRAVMAAYGFDVKSMTEAECVARLMEMYVELTK
ncbi:MAG: class I SAM-dependent DNA methyltransferase [Selenomonadaceae bacterium]|nr:class I SAM-dependent DNA methyltransferase [Selenomonadaceae bacterium]